MPKTHLRVCIKVCLNDSGRLTLGCCRGLVLGGFFFFAFKVGKRILVIVLGRHSFLWVRLGLKTVSAHQRTRFITYSSRGGREGIGWEIVVMVIITIRRISRSPHSHRSIVQAAAVIHRDKRFSVLFKYFIALVCVRLPTFLYTLIYPVYKRYIRWCTSLYTAMIYTAYIPLRYITYIPVYNLYTGLIANHKLIYRYISYIPSL
jgi:hypothetical protein